MSERLGFLGGSDIAAMLGLSPWSTPWSLWAEKVQLVTPRPASDEHEERLAVGKDAEAFLASVFCRHFPDLYLGGAQAEITNDDYPWLRGHADGFVLESPHSDIGDAIAGWEAKTDREYKPWSEVPVYYQCQAQTYMLLTGLTEWRFTVGFAGWKVEHYVIHADEADQALIVAQSREFWEKHVIGGEPPRTDGLRPTTDAIKAAYPNGDGCLEADDRLVAVVHELDQAKRTVKAMQTRIDSMENELRVALADTASDLTYGVNAKGEPNVIASWREQTTTRIDSKAVRAEHGDRFDTTSTSRVLRLHLPKPPKPTPEQKAS